jgi:hypothetical protein
MKGRYVARPDRKHEAWSEGGACSKMWKKGRGQDMRGGHNARSKRRACGHSMLRDLKGVNVTRPEGGNITRYERWVWGEILNDSMRGMWWYSKGHVVMFRRRAWRKIGRENTRQDVKEGKGKIWTRSMCWGPKWRYEEQSEMKASGKCMRHNPNWGYEAKIWGEGIRQDLKWGNEARAENNTKNKVRYIRNTAVRITTPSITVFRN